MTIRESILGFIASQPEGVGLQRIRAHLNDVSAAGVDQAVAALYRDGQIERMGMGIPPPKPPSLPMPVADGFVRPPSLARLMARR